MEVKIHAINYDYGVVNDVYENTHGIFDEVHLMPDTHRGATVPVGFVAKVDIEKGVIPEIVGVDIGCLDCDTEILTESGWIKISDYKENEKILQFNPITNTGMFIKPQLYIKKKCDWFYHFKNSKGLDQMISEEHNILMYYGHKNRKINYKTVKPEFLINLGDKKLSKNYYMFNTAFTIKNEGIEISDEMIRLDIMVQADGRIKEYDSYNFVELHFKKERKILRAENLLKNANIKYNKYLSTDTTYISFRVPKYINKNLKKYWKANYEQLKIVAEESLLWDGHSGYRSYYSSADKESIDVIQFAFIATDVRASLYNVKNTKYWTVIPTKNKYVGYNKKPKIVKSKDGYKYCFKTDNGFFLCRRNGYTFLTGNCGMSVYEIPKLDIENTDWKALYEHIEKYIPSGQKVNSQTRPFDFSGLKMKADKSALEYYTYYTKALGSLGGGNHFIEINAGKDKDYIIVHSGSRKFGLDVCKYYTKMLKFDLDGYRAELESIEPKNREKMIPSIKAKYNNSKNVLKGELAKEYLNDMKIAQKFASESRKIMIQQILKFFGIAFEEKNFWESVHNYMDFEDMIVRKGATPARLGQKLVVPINMRDGSIIAVGKGNPEWLCSAPHGAGRVMSRSEAKSTIDVEDYRNEMKNVISYSVNENTLDEAPQAYRGIDEIVEATRDTMDILEIVKPIFNFKGLQ